MTDNNKNPKRKTTPNRNKTPAKKQPVDAVGMQYDYFHSGLKTIKRLTVVMGVLTTVAIGTSFYSANKKTQNVYISAYENMEPMTLVPLSKPNLKETAISNWVTTALTDTFDFNYMNIEKHIIESGSKYFTRSGKDSLISALKEQGSFSSVIRNELIVTLNTKHNPIVVKQIPGAGPRPHQWIVQVPVNITFRTRENAFSNRMDVSMVVERVSLLSDPRGVRISKIIMRRPTGDSK
ncbi:DotI/IcmL family type IV secretion protein [Neptuniibacter sp. QD37_11]|uniref:DotI/IcmL family type IV secretion protein n=1 Tax=Neptuniibacter sp. QD37_11 TaxID=3398209 RepID=UPI0039F45A5A